MIFIFVLLVGILLSISFGILIRNLNQTKSDGISELFLFVIGFFALYLGIAMLFNLDMLFDYWISIIIILSVLLLSYLLTPSFTILEDKISYEKIRLSEGIILVFLIYAVIGAFIGTGINIGGVEGHIYSLVSFLMIWAGAGIIFTLLPLWYLKEKA